MTGFLPGILFRGRGKIYPYANFCCFSVVVGTNFRGGGKVSEVKGGKLPQGALSAPLRKTVKREHMTDAREALQSLYEREKFCRLNFKSDWEGSCKRISILFLVI